MAGLAPTVTSHPDPTLRGMLDGDDFPNAPSAPWHSGSLGLGQVVSSGATLSNVFAGLDRPPPREVAADTTAAAVESGGGEGGYEWWSPRREVFDTAASRLEAGAAAARRAARRSEISHSISRLVSHDKRSAVGWPCVRVW